MDEITLRDGEICLQLTGRNSDYFRAINLAKIREICFSDFSFDQKRILVWENSRAFYVCCSEHVDISIVLDGTEDKESWEDLAAYFELET